MDPTIKTGHDTAGLRPGILRDDLTTVVARRLYASWPAIFCGLATAIATVWFLSLLGSAIGMSVLDGTDTEAMGKGLGVSAIVWIVLTGFAAFLIGGLVTGRLCGQDDDQAGVLHGVTMWSMATLSMLLLSSWGISGLINTGASIVSGVSGAVSSAVSQVPATVQAMDGAVSDQRSNRALSGISASIKREISEAVAKDGGSAISKEEARAALDQLDGDALQEIGLAYLQDDKEAAKDILAARTDLSEEQVDQLSKSVSTKVEQRVNEYKKEIAKAVETASDYAQAVLWTAFVAAALGLIASILGAMWGCREAVRLHAIVSSRHGGVRTV